MSAGCVRWLFSHAGRTLCGGRPGHWTPASRLALCSEGQNILAASRRSGAFSTEAGDAEPAPARKKKKKKEQDPRAHATLNSVGRKIPQREIQVIGEAGENLGVMHRADVIRVMEEKGLKLVLLSEHRDPAVYQLMSGKQIHEEQLKLREKNKAKAAPVQVKELTFSAGIASHDLSTKLKQVESWLEKKHHVRITLRAERGQNNANLDATLEQMVEQMDVMLGFVSKPKVVRDGQAAVCILRPPSAKELLQQRKDKAAEPPPAGSAPDNSTNTTAAV
ncbi:translation initiation factor IF-3, mitochondrial [Menidia menidia]